MAKDKSYWETGGNRRYVISPDDVQDLERESGVHEFVNRKPRQEAEQAAYGDYTKKHHTQAAAHHLAHMKASQANGNYSDAKRHKILYDMHLKELGLDSTSGKVPEEIAQHMNNPDAPRPMKFKPHKADSFFINDKEEAPEEHSLSKSEVASRLADSLKRVLAKAAEETQLPLHALRPGHFIFVDTLNGGAWHPVKTPYPNFTYGDVGYGMPHADSQKTFRVRTTPGQDLTQTIPIGESRIIPPLVAAGKYPFPNQKSETLGDHAWAELAKSVALAVGPQAPAPGVVKPKEHVTQGYAPTIPGKRKATTNERRRGLLVPWQIDGTGVSKPSSLKQSELDKASVVDHKAGQQAAPGILSHPEDVADTVDTAPVAGVPHHRFGYSAVPHIPGKKPVPTIPGKKRLAIPGRTNEIARRKIGKADLDPEALIEGSADEEAEHELGPAISGKIAADHLKEDPNYYKKSALPGKKPYTGRDEGIRRSKLPPGAPGASKDGVGVQVDKKKESSKRAARGKVKGES